MRSLLGQWLLGWRRRVFGGGVERVLCVLVDEGNEVLERAITIVVDEVTGASFLELNGRETGDTERRRWGNVVVNSFHLSTEQVRMQSKSVFGSEQSF